MTLCGSNHRLDTSTRFELSISVKAVLSALEHACGGSCGHLGLDRVGCICLGTRSRPGAYLCTKHYICSGIVRNERH